MILGMLRGLYFEIHKKSVLEKKGMFFLKRVNNMSIIFKHYFL